MFRLYTVIALVTVLSVLALAATVADEPRVLLLSVVAVPATIAGAFAARSALDNPSRKMRSLSPEGIAGYRSPEEIAGERELSVRELSRSIVERSEEIRRTASGSPTEVQVEMCAIGYRSCVNDMISLTNKINAALPEAGFLEKIRLRTARRRATDSLSKTRQALPPSALRTTRQELQ